MQDVTALFDQEIVLRLGLYTLGDNDEIQTMPHGNDRAHNRRIAGFVRNIGDEGAVNFQFGNWQSLERRQLAVLADSAFLKQKGSLCTLYAQSRSEQE